MSMRVAKEDMNGGIVVIGNAPTALLEVIRNGKRRNNKTST